MKKEHFLKEISSHHVVEMIRKDNQKLTLALIFNALALLVAICVIWWLKSPKITVQRLYTDPSQNETIPIAIESRNAVTKQDIHLLVRYIVEHLDFKSANTAANIARIADVSEGEFLRQLLSEKEALLAEASHSGISAIYNSVTDLEYTINKSIPALIVETAYTQTTLFKNGKNNEEEKTIKLALKMVDRKEYAKQLHLGGWYYGFMLIQMDKPLHSL